MALVGSLALAGCSSSKKATTADAGGDSKNGAAIQLVGGTAASHGKTGDGTVQPSASPSATAAAAKPSAKWIQLTATKVSIGDIIAEVHGLTLYRFDDDGTNPSTSNCTDQCAVKWPPVIIEPGGNVYVTGVDGSKLNAVRRSDGSLQLTLGGSPMYTFSGDKAAGDLNGQGLDNKWFAFAPDGSKNTGLFTVNGGGSNNPNGSPTQ